MRQEAAVATREPRVRRPGRDQRCDAELGAGAHDGRGENRKIEALDRESKRNGGDVALDYQ